MSTVSFIISGTGHSLSSEQVEAAAEGLPGESIREHYVVVGGVKYPVKALFSAVTGLDRLDFTTSQARRIFRKLGFELGRVG